MSVHIFGIRHHGPGSARSLLAALTALQPDIILVEGPPDAAEVLSLLVHPNMQPPVALLIYVPDQPHRAVYYPFAVFSPEWQAMRYGLAHGLPVRFMDLPQAHGLAMAEAVPPAQERPPDTDQQPDADQQIGPAQPDTPASDIRRDPLRWLAEAAGYSDGERWWEHMVEQRRDSADVFAAILEAMTALRREVEACPPDGGKAPSPNMLEAQREAYMRQTIRAAQRESFQRIAVVCGAWHAPALADMPPATGDQALLKGLPKVKVQATWVPWTNGRLAWASGYGAGIESPGWYHHLWLANETGLHSTETAIGWLTGVARLLRGEDLDASSASVIEAVRLAEALAALRDRPLPGLPELNEAAQAVFCFDSDLPMRLINQRLIIGESLGHVPDETPMLPLQQDLARSQRRLRFEPEATRSTLDLDLRKPIHLERSYLLHRLNLLGVAWGKLQRASNRKKGTFHEIWQLQWQPEFAVAVIEAAMWGLTLHSASTAYARHLADQSPDLPALTGLLNRALLADLPEVVIYLMERVQAEAAIASDVAALMGALPSLVEARYSVVRKADTDAVAHVIDGLVTRICIGLPAACAALNDEAAAAMFEHLLKMHEALITLQNEAHLAAWYAVLAQLADQAGLHGLIAGRCGRLLLEAGAMPLKEVAARMSLALSAANEPAQAGAWVEGLLKGSGSLLLHNASLWQALDDWLTGLSGESFVAALPLLRRTFATFTQPERRDMGERIRHGRIRAEHEAASSEFDRARAEAVLPLLARLLGAS